LDACSSADNLSLLILVPLVRLALSYVRRNDIASDQETMYRLLAFSELLQSHRVQADPPPSLQVDESIRYLY
jgi:hypothetical protein